MIGLHRTTGGLAMRRDEHPIRRINPSGQEAWIARYTDMTGKRRSAGTFKRRGPCKHPGDRCCAQHAIWKAYEQDAPPAPNVLTVGGYFHGSQHEDDGWLDRHPRGERTAENYRYAVQSVLDVETDGKPFRDVPLADVRRLHMLRLVDVMLRERGRAASGASQVIARLSAMFENANDDGVMEGNPARGVHVRSGDPRVQRPKRTVTVASWEQMHEFARAAGEYEPMVRVLSDCGVRLGEMLALECRHVQGDKLLVVQNSWGGVVSPGTKQSPGRSVPIPASLSGILAAQARDRIGLLFPAPNGRVWLERNFYRRVWYPAQQASGMSLRPHDMRHSYVSLMRAAGIDPADLAEATGHDVSTATNTYTHSTGASMDAMKAVVDGRR